MLFRYPDVNRFSWDFSPVQICKKADSEHLYLKDTARAAGNSWRLAEGIAAASFAPKHAWQKTPTKSRPSVWNSRASNWNSLNCWPLFFFANQADWQVKGFLFRRGLWWEGAQQPQQQQKQQQLHDEPPECSLFLFLLACQEWFTRQATMTGCASARKEVSSIWIWLLTFLWG